MSPFFWIPFLYLTNGSWWPTPTSWVSAPLQSQYPNDHRSSCVYLLNLLPFSLCLLLLSSGLLQFSFLFVTTGPPSSSSSKSTILNCISGLSTLLLWNSLISSSLTIKFNCWRGPWNAPLTWLSFFMQNNTPSSGHTRHDHRAFAHVHTSAEIILALSMVQTKSWPNSWYEFLPVNAWFGEFSNTPCSPCPLPQSGAFAVPGKVWHHGMQRTGVRPLPS